MPDLLFDQENSYFKLAFDFIEKTNCSLYLTGKAGTGKTTFLKQIRNHSSKKMVVVAPTGVAAINATGVTIHSFFQLPFATFIADAPRGFGVNSNIVDRHLLLKNFKINNNKKKIIEELELLIIDEVSMLRADLLDAIDTLLKIFRQNENPFGGVQVLFIGDLYQLPPVVKDTEKELFSTYYESPYFFHAAVFKQIKLVFIELKKVYRQNEYQFINLLNNIRYNELSYEDFEMLNQRYKPEFEPPPNEQYITLTTHNAKADEINKRELEKINEPLFLFNCSIEGEVNEKHFPTEMQLKLKKGAQVMFVKNDSSGEGNYYNGRIAKIINIADDEIIVQFDDATDYFTVNKETWENITFEYNEELNTVEEKVIGTFTQYPLKLAWAITIHKSQGLTFNQAIIDAGASFAPGQVYVALSRCVSLDGVILLSKINAYAIQNDSRIYHFSMGQEPLHVLEQQLEYESQVYDFVKISKLFQWRQMTEMAYELYKGTLAAKALPTSYQAVQITHEILKQTQKQEQVADKFLLQLQQLFSEWEYSRNHHHLIARLKKAIHYFANAVFAALYMPLHDFYNEIKNVTRIKKYLERVLLAENQWWTKIENLQKASLNGELIYPTPLIYKPQIIEPLNGKKAKGDSAKETLAFYKSGKSIDEIAQMRNLKEATILTHLATFILTGELDIKPFLKPEAIQEIKSSYQNLSEFSLSNLFNNLQQKYSHAEIRMAINYLIFKKEIQDRT
ncbi:MAG TPA: helix-turn-helix domain-containing protein [Chitinophagaceae bacterium]|nr:helix-turn-helix domain-containing protein [Chitinophagaceae bacterium]